MHLTVLLVMAVAQTMSADPAKLRSSAMAIKADERKPKEEGLRRELLQRMRSDQDVRKSMLALIQKYRGRDPEQIEKMDQPGVKRLNEIDRQNTDRMKEIVKRYGWPGKSLVGTAGAHAAWLLVQHADHDRPFQERCLSLLTEAFKKGEASGEELAYLTDRIRVDKHEKQVYGTQFREVNGTLQPEEVEDQRNVDKRRREMGLPHLADYLLSAERVYKTGHKGKQ